MRTSKELTSRFASEYGETLIVRVIEGVKALVDPCDEGTVIHVQSGRSARLVSFSFSGLCRLSGRDVNTTVTRSDAGLGFVSVVSVNFRVLLRDLSEGQFVDILPASDTAAAYAVLLRPVPALYGAAVVQYDAAIAA
jgi:hypothetical protein